MERRLEESGIVTRCEITTYEPDALMDLPFDDELKVQKLIMKVRVPYVAGEPWLNLLHLAVGMAPRRSRRNRLYLREAHHHIIPCGARADTVQPL